MNLTDIVRRSAPAPWADGGKIPWSEPGFSSRMLREHLSQEHDAASRRFEVIDRHVAWIHEAILERRPGRILDLGCGPGLYTIRLAGLGHRCVGIDFSPASIRYARSEAERAGASCEYHHRDLRDGDYGLDFDLALLTYGEFNTFPPEEAAPLLGRIHAALSADGRLLLEVPTFESLRRLGDRPPTWHAATSGLFSDDPYICLEESAWSESHRTSVERHLAVDAATGEAMAFTSTLQAYTEKEYREVLASAGFDDIRRYPSLQGSEAADAGDFFVLTGRKGSGR